MGVDDRQHPKGLWYVVELEHGPPTYVVLEHGAELPLTAGIRVRLTPKVAAALGASLIAYAIEADPEGAREAVLRVLLPLTLID